VNREAKRLPEEEESPLKKLNPLSPRRAEILSRKAERTRTQDRAGHLDKHVQSFCRERGRAALPKKGRKRTTARETWSAVTSDPGGRKNPKGEEGCCPDHEPAVKETILSTTGGR